MSVVLAFFGLSGILKLVSKGLVVSALGITFLALGVAHAAAIYFLFRIASFFYTQYQNLMTFIGNGISSNNEINLIFQIMQSMGILQAFHDVFIIFAPIVVAYFVYIGAMATFRSLQLTSDQIFKIGLAILQ